MRGIPEEAVPAEETQELSVPDWAGIYFDSSFDWELLEAVGDDSAGRISLADIKKQYYTRLDIQWFQHLWGAEQSSRQEIQQLRADTDFEVADSGEFEVAGHQAEFVAGSHAYSPNEMGYTVLNRMIVFGCKQSGRWYHVTIVASAYEVEIARTLVKKAMHSFSCHTGGT